MDAEGRDSDVSFAQRKDQEDVSCIITFNLSMLLMLLLVRICRDYYRGHGRIPPL